MTAARAGAHSPAERLAHRLLVQAGIRGWQANVEIRDDRGLIGVGDIVFEQPRVVVEIDGRAYHVTPDRFQRDRSRQNRLVTVGWTVLRLTWQDLTERPAHCVELIRTAIRQDRRRGNRT